MVLFGCVINDVKFDFTNTNDSRHDKEIIIFVSQNCTRGFIFQLFAITQQGNSIKRQVGK